jgi:hypothetical protein
MLREQSTSGGAMTRIATVVVLSCGLLAAALDGQQPTAANNKVNPDAALLQDFKHRIDAYVQLHKRLEKKAPPLKETEDPAKIKASQDALAAAILRERANARQGDIFTPEIANLFRRLMHPEVKGQKGAETKAALKEDAPPPKTVPLKVNARYPEEAPLPTVPPNLLASLPQLPEELEYRIVGRNLILRDVHANLIVDFIPNAIR